MKKVLMQKYKCKEKYFLKEIDIFIFHQKYSQMINQHENW